MNPFEGMSEAVLTRGIAEIQRLQAGRRLSYYAPYPKQRDFHKAGATFAERLLLGANQSGKTTSAAAEWAMHLTGRYPDWWDGLVFPKAPILWAGGVTGESTRDNPQRLLVGPPALEEAWGTGMIPKDAIQDKDRAMGVPNLLDNIVVKHGGGGDVQAGKSLLAFKAYEKGREKWQGPTVDGVWFDEEPPIEIYAEGLTRTNNGQHGQCAMATLTPLLGMSDMLSQFLMGDSPYRKVVTMTIDDAGHYTPEERKQIIASYPPHEREARARGIPTLGSGRVFPVEEAMISVQPFKIPTHWPRIVGLDFGWDHPTAAAWLAWDRDTDTVYIYDAYRVREAPVPMHAHSIMAKGKWIPVAWPHDGNNDTAAGPQLAKQYKIAGVNMRTENAKFPLDHKNTQRSLISVEAGVSDMLTRMQTGQWKVFAHLADWFEEFRLYHRKDGKIVKERDDLISASRYGLMDLRYAKVMEPTRPTMRAMQPLDPEMNY